MYICKIFTRVSGAAFFDFTHAHMSAGRLNGARCGSCDIVGGKKTSSSTSTSTSISRGCAYDSFDASCSSSYCDSKGICAPHEVSQKRTLIYLVGLCICMCFSFEYLIFLYVLMFVQLYSIHIYVSR
jgi:hypothetical protein